jgi:hypothetical protein
MASSYTTGFSFEKIGSGEQSGAWGDTTNFNWDIVDRLASYKAVAITTNADTHTLTVREASPGSGTENLQDGMYRVIKFTGALDSNCTVTIAPNTAPAYFIINNATTDSGSSGPYSLIFTQGSGANITVENGKSAVIYCDGAGSGAAIVDAISNLALATITASGDITVSGTFNALGDTAASDKAAVGYTSAEGLILTGQGSTNDVTIKNDADQDVIEIPTGTQNVTTAGDLAVAGDLTITGDDLVMSTNTSGAALIADGTNFNPVVISGDATVATNGALTIANDAITSAKIADDAITSALIADDAVTLAKMASGTDGNIISYDASGNPVAIATGNDGQVLTSTGAGSPPAFEDAAGGGKMLQVVSATWTTSTQTTSGSYADVTNGTATITPAATGSKVLILVSLGVFTDSDNSAVGEFKIVRTISGSASDVSNSVFSQVSHTSRQSGNHFLMVLDSPSTTSAAAYKLQFFRCDQSGYVEVNRNDGSDIQRSVITLIEVGT